jgi:hypothetical protein
MGRQAKKTRGGYVSYPLETSMHAAAKKQQATSRSPPARPQSLGSLSVTPTSLLDPAKIEEDVCPGGGA